MGKRVKIDGVHFAITEELEEFGKLCDDAVESAVVETAKESSKELQAASRSTFGGTGAYARGWTYKKEPAVALDHRAIVYNRDKYRLTHLLEKGHKKVLWGHRKGGRVAGRPHIKPVEEKAQVEFVRRIKEGIGKA